MPRREVRPTLPGGRCRECGLCRRACGCRYSDASSGAEEVVVDVLLPLVAEERDDVPEVRVPRPELAGGDQLPAATRAHEHPALAGQARLLAQRPASFTPAHLI